MSKWPQIVGTFFADHSEPDRISRVTEEFNELDEPIFKNFLHVKVSPAALLNFNTIKIQLLRKLIVFLDTKLLLIYDFSKTIFQKQKLIINLMK